MNCQNCGIPLEDGAKFCGNCGQLVNDDTTAHAQQPLAPGNPLYVPVDPALQSNRSTAVQGTDFNQKRAKPLSIKWPAVTGIVLGALYLLGSGVTYTEELQDYSTGLIIAVATIDVLLGLLIFVPGLLLLRNKSNKFQISLLQIQYIASLVIAVLSVLSFRPAGLLFLIPGLLARRAQETLKSSS